MTNEMMNKNDAEDVLSIINNEGFDYAFMHYTSFKEIKDKKFHKLRRDYIKAQKNLEEYIEVCSSQNEQEENLP
jgi:hypothetical protein